MAKEKNLIDLEKKIMKDIMEVCTSFDAKLDNIENYPIIAKSKLRNYLKRTLETQQEGSTK